MAGNKNISPGLLLIPTATCLCVSSPADTSLKRPRGHSDEAWIRPKGTTKLFTIKYQS